MGRTRTTVFWMLATLTTVVGAPMRIAAQDAAEEGPQSSDHEGVTGMHVRMARGFYESGRFEQAAREYERAFERSGDPQLLYDAFVAWHDAGRLDRAIAALEGYLGGTGPIPNRAELEGRLQSMRQLAAQQRAAGETGSETGSDAGTETGTDAGTETGTDAGTETGTDAGTETGSDAGAESGAETETETEAGAETEAGTGTEAGVGVGVGAGPVGAQDGSAVAAWIVVGVGAGLVAGGIATGVLALQAEKDLEGLCTPGEGGDYRCPPDSGFRSTRDRGQVLATATDVLVVSGVFAVAAGLGLRYLLGDGGVLQTASAGVACAPSSCGGSVQVRF